MIAVAPTIVRKVEGMIALAASDRREEARTAAYLACKQIREHGLRVVAATTSQSGGTRPKSIYAQYGCVCLGCRAEIYIGDRCVWLKGRGCWHPECAP